MAKAQLRDRIFALLGAVLFLVTSLGLSVYVIWQMHQDNRAKQQQAKQQQCTISTVPAETLPAPATYKQSQKVVTLQFQDLHVGSGAAAKAGDCLDVKYYATLASNGQEFDNNFAKPTALKFNLGAGQVIPGWDQGLVGIKVGGTRRLVIPASLAYGSQAQGAIPANSDLVFVVKLEKIE